MILAAVAALTLASCAKIDTFTVSENDGNMPIGFTNYAPKSLTKADADTYASGTTLVEGADFSVWGWSTENGTSFNGTNGTAFFGNPGKWYGVTYDDEGGAGTDGSANTYNDGVRYWPSGDSPAWLSFYAYYPSNATTYITDTPDGLGEFEFTVAEAAEDQVDFMVADVVPNQVYGSTNASPTNPGTVNFTFKHQLTKVQVKFKTTQSIVDDANTNITVNSAAFGNIKNSGTLTVSYLQKDNTGKFSDETGYSSSATPLTYGTRTAWSAVTGTAEYTIAVPSGNLNATAANSGADADDIFLLVPQTMTGPTRDGTTGAVTSDTGAQYIDVAWTVTTDGVATANTKRIYLDECTNEAGTAQANIDWAKNNFITYVITIAPRQILFTGAVTGWDDETFGYFSVN